MSNMCRSLSLAFLCCVAACARNETAAPPSTAQPPPPLEFTPIRVITENPGIAPDGLPTGQDTAEGAACDLARAFINPNPDLFRKVCYPQRRKPGTDAYNDFLDEMVADMEKVKGMPIGQAGGPKAIARVFKARHLSANGPGSFGYAVMRLLEVQFVDLETPLWNGGNYTNRTLVVKSEDSGKWYVIPRPDLFELLSQGLNGESDSTELWTPPATK